MQRRHLLLAMPGLLVLPVQAQRKRPAEVPEALRLQAEAQMRFFGLRIYDIRLWVAEHVNAENWARQTLALELEYARSLSGREIAKRSLVEMRRQAEISEDTAQRWLGEMEAAFPDVKAGDRISGLFEPARGVQFFINSQPRRQIADSEFARLFSGIWLAPQSSEPGMREQLLKRSADSSQARGENRGPRSEG
ncbi:chalcone isomerase family protein [Paucibacter sp. DJ1R-11]|uniref:chalcone isomerase family protein n=1 Tax=Paucibacter sp. DJ1R-11 TaxID=2893556 RepID=UPI0021E42B4A|nr:chalcone isomerase family protein [Paucibacter sp. DJ1R-11]MCV2362193.1 chalcone isomerase family protein [Paucibacter sp. DJ1R-11]